MYPAFNYLSSMTGIALAERKMERQQRETKPISDTAQIKNAKLTLRQMMTSELDIIMIQHYYDTLLFKYYYYHDTIPHDKKQDKSTTKTNIHRIPGYFE